MSGQLGQAHRVEPMVKITPDEQHQMQRELLGPPGSAPAALDRLGKHEYSDARTSLARPVIQSPSRCGAREEKATESQNSNKLRNNASTKRRRRQSPNRRFAKAPRPPSHRPARTEV